MIIRDGVEAGEGRLAWRSRLAVLTAPESVLAASILACAVLLTLPLKAPLGAMYWDLVLYLDAANRISAGQTPLIDFLTPVGPLGYWLFAWLDGLFPRSQPLLLAQWSVLPVTALPMLMILRDVGRRSRSTAFFLLIPYLIFQLIPVNIDQFSIFPGFDGFGIYNRHVSVTLYVMTAALLFMRERRQLVFIIVWTMLALLLIKITGFIAGGLLVGYAIIAGRVERRDALVAALIGALFLLAGEAAGGLTSAYLDSILELVAINSGSILPRFLQTASLHLDIFVSGGTLIAVLLFRSRRVLAASGEILLRERSWAALNRFFDRDAGWLAVALAAGLFFETQNTGGQALIFAWPMLLAPLLRALDGAGPGRFLICGLVAATAIPPAATVLQRAGRTLLAQIRYEALPHQHLGRLGQVTQTPEVMMRGKVMNALYAAHPEPLLSMADQGLLPSQTFYFGLDFQAGWLMAIDAGVAAILDHEARTGRRFETIMSLNFANPFPFLMNRSAVRHLPIGADPTRSVPEPDAAAIAAIGAADLILYPRCPYTMANLRLLTRYKAAFAGRREIELGPCWKGFVKP